MQFSTLSSFFFNIVKTICNDDFIHAMLQKKFVILNFEVLTSDQKLAKVLSKSKLR